MNTQLDDNMNNLIAAKRVDLISQGVWPYPTSKSS
jgi:hypothetical protein